MSIVRMALLEIGRRKRTFLLAAVAVAVASATMLGSHATLRAYGFRAERMLQAKEAETKKRLKQLQDEMRKATLKLSFNLVILPGAQDIRKWHEMDYATATMPEDYVGRMSRSKMLAVRHFLPTLSQKVEWPERNRTVILVGCRGEVPNLAKAPRSPLVQPVPAGTMVIGYELHHSLDLRVGQTVRFMGREFKIHKCNRPHGSKDDIGVWIPLKDAQELLDKPGRINAILALECICAGEEGLERIRAEIAKVLPDTKVIELGSKVIARSEARNTVKAEVQAAFKREQENQKELSAERGKLATIVVPGVVIACGLWILLVALANSRGRKLEVAILRTVGFRASQILAMFLFRYLLSGLLGAIMGCAIGLVIASGLRGQPPVPLMGSAGMLSWPLVIATFLIGFLLGVVAGWGPALLAARQDPAEILREA